MDYLILPCLLKDGYLTRGDLQQSITHSVGLILSTRPGMMGFASDFGCNIWEREYSDLLSANKANIRAGLRNAIDKFEKRLYNVSVSFTPPKDVSVRALGLNVRVSGNYRDGEEEKKFEGTYYLG